jgi:protoheme IX farnesyltransferase
MTEHRPDAADTPAVTPSGVAELRARAADYVMLAKPRLNVLVVVTALAGYYMGVIGPAHTWLLVHMLVGTTLVASGSAVVNQLLEIEADGMMRRTRARPLPSGRLTPVAARVFATILSVVGVVQLALGVNLLAAGIALATLLTYTAFYTPLKKRSSLATVVGGVPGALPPMIGWAAARNNLSAEAWVLFGIVFLWQMPHFLAIAWMYREDYKRAGFPLLPIVEPDGVSTGRQALLYAAALLPVSLAPTAVAMAGVVYLSGAALLGLAFTWLAFRFSRTRSTPDARKLFFGSIIYLPLLWILMLTDRITP